MSTRASARLAKIKGKRARPDTVEIHDDPGRDASDGYVDSEPEEQKPPPRKRQRTTTKSSKAVVRQKQIRGKQGRLAGLVNMPVDIFTEVASHLLPADIISLARSNKLFRNLLMTRSAIHIWHSAMKNVEELPPCPAGMSEPHFLSLLFSKTCSMCGALARVNMDPFILVRLCGPCRNAHLMPLNAVPSTLIPWIHCAASIAPAKRRSCSTFVLRSDFNELLAEYEEKKRLKDDSVLEAWTKERREIVDKRQKDGIAILEFLDAMQWDREQELVNIKVARRLEINRRLTEMGWTEKDMDFGWWSSHSSQWHDLVSQAKPITDRVWVNLQQKLVPLLEANREERRAMERKQLQQERRVRLSALFSEIRMNSFPALELKALNPITRISGSMPTISFIHQGPFPDIAHTLDWPLVKNLYETDSSVEEMEAEFEKNRGEIEALVTGWKDRIQTYFVNLIRHGYEARYEVPRPATLTCSKPDSPANASDDLKLLLRADSLFYSTKSSDLPKEILSYDSFLSSGCLKGILPIYGTLPLPAPNLDHVHWYLEAHEAARQLLADMGRPDASYLEMETAGRVFACGRCHETKSRNWNEMVQHYIEQDQLHAKVQADISRLSDVGVTYNDVHSSTLLTDRPMVTDYATKTLDSGLDGTSRLHVCKLCEKIPAAGELVALRPFILRHLSDVHGITEPKVDEHYIVLPSSLGLFGMDGYDSDDSYSDYYFGGCDCPFHQMLGGHGYDDEDEDEDYW